MNTAALQIVLVNGKPIEVGLDASLGGVLHKMGFGDKRGVAAAVNDAVVRRSEWNAKILSAGDRVLVIQATQGG
jgi:sulfur carrier protein